MPDAPPNRDGWRLVAFPAGVTGVVSTGATAPPGWAPNPPRPIPTVRELHALRPPDFSAPGGDGAYPGDESCNAAGYVLPACPFDLVVNASTRGSSFAVGTGMAAPHAAGVAALVTGAAGGELQVGRVERALKRGADDVGGAGSDELRGFGRVGADASAGTVRPADSGLARPGGRFGATPGCPSGRGRLVTATLRGGRPRRERPSGRPFRVRRACEADSIALDPGIRRVTARSARALDTPDASALASSVQAPPSGRNQRDAAASGLRGSQRRRGR